MGESGAGKTVTTHHLTQYLCQNEGHLTKHATAMLKLLDFFGNAETIDNRDSSRFVKLLKVFFGIFNDNNSTHIFVCINNLIYFISFQFNYNSNNEVSGINISHHFLEISRLCGETTFGSNFHICHILAMEAPSHLKERLGLKNRHFRVSDIF